MSLLIVFVIAFNTLLSIMVMGRTRSRLQLSFYGQILLFMIDMDPKIKFLDFKKFFWV